MHAKPQCGTITVRGRETQADGKTGREKQRQRRWEKARGGRARSRTSQQEGEMVCIEMAAQFSQLDTNITDEAQKGPMKLLFLNFGDVWAAL